MTKLKKIYICTNCGHKEIKWQGKCPSCGAWNSFEEDVIASPSKKTQIKQLTDFSSPPIRLSDIKSQAIEKKPTGIAELDRVLDGGTIGGQIILVGGVPGIGKSTLMLSVASSFASNKNEVLYVSGEESLTQISHRAERISVKNSQITILCESDITKIIQAIDNLNCSLLIIDSIQTLYHPEIPSSPSSPLQIRYVTSEIIKAAKSKNIVTFILAHVTKEGDIAGPKLLEHMVDTVLYFEADVKGPYRILRSFKNRFGSVDEIGIFELNDKGIFSSHIEITPSEITPIAGKTHTCIVEGTRAFITRIEALVSRTFYPYPKRVFYSIDSNYAQILLASIEKNTRFKLESYDVYINIPTAFKTKDKASDLAVCGAVLSSLTNTKLPKSTAFIGEVGMLGQVYPVSYITKRINELEKNGFKMVIIPDVKEKIDSKIEIIKISHISEIERFFQ
ncbi:MAG: DNA repair protein RadA [Elusimicrobiales bacterium]